jgi:hypothetical protein
MHQALADAKWDEVARLLREEWKLRRSNAPGITTPLIDKLISITARQGGRAAKACGAGGGGCVIFLVEQGAASRVATAIGDNGGRCPAAPGCPQRFAYLVCLKRQPRGDSRPRLSSRAQLDSAFASSKIAKLCSAGQPRTAVPTWFIFPN